MGRNPKSQTSRGKLKNLNIMKKIVFFLLISLLTFNLLKSQEENKGLSTVNKIKFKEVYVYSEPIRSYEIVGEVYSMASQLLTVTSQVIEDIPNMKSMIDNLVSLCITKEQKGKVKNFDGIITYDGYIAYLIKFKDENTEKSGLGRVKKLYNKDIYVMCEPLVSYEIIGEVAAKKEQILSADQSIDTFMKILIENTIRIMNVYYPDLTYDAIIANDCNKAFIIKYK